VTQSPDGTTRLVVTDDGHGFDPQVRARREEHGHLGLTLVDEVVTQAGGKLTVRSAPGAGTTVEMQLPRR
jgi:signal transduction histidine kinase